MQILYSEEEAGTQLGIKTHVVKKKPRNSGLSISYFSLVQVQTSSGTSVKALLKSGFTTPVRIVITH